MGVRGIKKRWSRVVRETRKQRKESVYWRARSLALHELEHIRDIDQKRAGVWPSGSLPPHLP